MRESASNWTVAVYLAGGEGLSSGMIRSLQDLRDEAIAKPDLDVVAQFDPSERAPRLFSFVDGGADLSLGPDFVPASFSVPAGRLASYEHVPSDPAAHHERSPQQMLSEFIRLARGRSEAKAFMLVLSGHGNGAVGELFGYRGHGRALRATDLRPAIRSAGVTTDEKIDLIGMDCCNMNMVEVGFELSSYARYLVGSESIVPSYGWPYRQILARMHEESPEDAARSIPQEYAEFYSDYRLSGVATHCAALDLGRFEDLVDPVRHLAETLLDNIYDPSVWRPVVLAHWEAQSYKNEEYVDFADFCARLALHSDDARIRTAAGNVIQSIRSVVAASYASGSAFQYSTGLSVYFPWCNDAVKARGELGRESDLDAYRSLLFSERTMWGEFLSAYLDATRRDGPDGPRVTPRTRPVVPASAADAAAPPRPALRLAGVASGS